MILNDKYFFPKQPYSVRYTLLNEGVTVRFEIRYTSCYWIYESSRCRTDSLRHAAYSNQRLFNTLQVETN